MREEDWGVFEEDLGLDIKQTEDVDFFDEFDGF